MISIIYKTNSDIVYRILNEKPGIRDYLPRIGAMTVTVAVAGLWAMIIFTLIYYYLLI
jgi:hypothetical protein